MERVYLLHHVRRDDENGNDAKLVGVYRSKAAAEAAITRVGKQSGFVDYPDGFQIEAYELDKDHWAEGFVAMLPSDENSD